MSANVIQRRTLSRPSDLRSRLQQRQPPIVVAGVHDALGAAVAQSVGYEAVWASSLGISAAHALPDAGLLGLQDYLQITRMITATCDVPVIADCDTGFGNAMNVAYTVRQFEAAGVSAICIEDKAFPKLNSFAGRRQILEPIGAFQSKIHAAVHARRDPETIVIARTESFIAGYGLDEALARAHAYADAGADALLIHSKARTADEVESFLDAWRRDTPIVVVPTTYFDWNVEEAARAGASMVIHANQALRASVTAMRRAFDTMLSHGSSAALESEIASVKDIFGLQNLEWWLEFDR